jgi:hypothetical protein
MSNLELRTLDQIMALPDNGDFLSGFLEEHRNLILALHQHQMEYGGKPKGSFTLKVNYELDRKLTLNMTAKAEVTPPTEPAASAVAWTSADGFVTPENPAQMKMDLRDAGSHRDIRSAGE